MEAVLVNDVTRTGKPHSVPSERARRDRITKDTDVPSRSVVDDDESIKENLHRSKPKSSTHQIRDF